MSETKRLRQRPVAGGRAKEYHVAVTAVEREELEKRSLSQGITVPRYLVDVGLNRDPGLSRVTVTVLNGMKLQLTGTAANLNQLAHQANLGGYDLQQHELAVESYIETNNAIRDFLREVRAS